MSEPLLSRELDKYCENPNETLKGMLDESGIFFRVKEYTTPYSSPKIVLDTTKHDLEIRTDERAKIVSMIEEIAHFTLYCMADMCDREDKNCEKCGLEYVINRIKEQK